MGITRNLFVAGAEGTTPDNRVNRQGSAVSIPQYMQWAIEGRVFGISPLVQEAGDLLGETSPGTDNINPGILVQVPTGTTIVLLEMMFAHEGTGTVGDWMIRASLDGKLRYSSGGGANTIYNLRKDKPRASLCSAYNGGTQIVANANTDDDTFWVAGIDDSVQALNAVRWSALEHVPPVLVGPSSLLVFVKVSNVDEEVNYSVKWAEFLTTEIT
ncbi:MAG TPA: hypothetical protein ACFYED_00160 [Candidatus Tripitaka californicus]|uniref:hypothetical protein n=1 Tax=Candidatus Tripitaka californicus TaxID=3367616 RepID=UPI0040277C1B